jgi:hypothetical protein
MKLANALLALAVFFVACAPEPAPERNHLHGSGLGAVHATDEEAMQVAFLYQRAHEIDADLAAITSRVDRVYADVANLRALDGMAERFLDRVRARTGLDKPVWDPRSSNWLDGVAVVSTSNSSAYSSAPPARK